MTTNQRAVNSRNRMKKRKPDFVVRASKFKVGGRIKVRWRRARGRHSAIRQHHRGRPKQVSTGYGSPREVRGLHSSGLERVLVHTVAEMRIVNPTLQGAVIASTVSNRARVELLRAAMEKKIRVLNIRDPAKVVQGITQGLEDRKKVKVQRIADKSKKDEEKVKKAEEKKKKQEQEKTAKAAHSHTVDDKVQPKENAQEQKQHVDKEQVDKEITKRQ